jgi:threonine/homoserine/homoserine lactone efflux protein
MDFLLEIINTTGSPFIMVILLALVFSFDPCPMLTNIAAIGYINQDVANKKQAFIKGLWYVFGRTAAYGCLGLAIIILLKIGGNINAIQRFLGEWGEMILIPFMILTGILMCIADYIPALKIGVNNVNVTDKSHRGRFGAFILGAVLSLAFCPTNAVIFFGMIVPIASASVWGYFLALVFAAVTAIPVLIIAWILAFSFESIGRYYDKIKLFGKWFKWIVGLLFIAIGIYLAIEYFNGGEEHNHRENFRCTQEYYT